MTRFVLVTLAALSLCHPAFADDLSADEKIMSAASTVLALAMRTDGHLVVDSEDHAHLEGSSVTFDRINECVYAERVKSLANDHFLVVNFRKVGFRYGGLGGDYEVEGDYNANCWRYSGSQPLCSGALHAPYTADMGLLEHGLAYIHSHGCAFGGISARPPK